ncbi:MAG TPA: hypothetical protein VHM88_27780 [Candidatus Acidoferrales bacterium]|nr:hypothetical protein [Candidatus Acidoferrales bacterium]
MGAYSTIAPAGNQAAIGAGHASGRGPRPCHSVRRGACKAVKTTPLITIAEAVEAMKKASTSGYRAATV